MWANRTTSASLPHPPTEQPGHALLLACIEDIEVPDTCEGTVEFPRWYSPLTRTHVGLAHMADGDQPALGGEVD